MRRRTAFTVLLLSSALIASCPPAPPPVTTSPDAGPSSWRMPARPDCAGSYAELPAETEGLEDPLLVEVSGLVASPSQPGVLWMHNDSGDDARLYAATPEGKALLRLVLDDVEWTDAEDIAAAPCPDGSGPCLWVADTGNNRADRDEVFVYAIPEPTVDVSQGIHEEHVDAAALWRFPLRYPDGAFDSEAFVVLPDASALVLLEKRDGPASRVAVLEAPFVRDGVNTLDVRGTIPSPGVEITGGRMITGADLHPNGERMLIRSYTGVFEVFLGDGESALDLAGKAAQTVTLGPLSEPQGEAIAYDATGKGLWTVSEDPNQQAPKPLHHYACFE